MINSYIFIIEIFIYGAATDIRNIFWMIIYLLNIFGKSF